MATILIVDDLPSNRTFLVTVLRAHGYRVLEASDGAEGLATVRADHPDLVITDVLMPVMDGFELLKRLRLDPAIATIPVVFYTAHYGAREARALALSGGVSDVLLKPAAAADVLSIVGRMLSGESQPAWTDASLQPQEFDREHLSLLTGKVSSQVEDLGAANATLRALINIGRGRRGPGRRGWRSACWSDRAIRSSSLRMPSRRPRSSMRIRPSLSS